MTENDVKNALKEGICPRCRRKLTHSEGCMECSYCGWSECAEA